MVRRVRGSIQSPRRFTRFRIFSLPIPPPSLQISPLQSYPFINPSVSLYRCITGSLSVSSLSHFWHISGTPLLWHLPFSRRTSNTDTLCPPSGPRRQLPSREEGPVLPARPLNASSALPPNPQQAPSGRSTHFLRRRAARMGNPAQRRAARMRTCASPGSWRAQRAWTLRGPRSVNAASTPAETRVTHRRRPQTLLGGI